MFEIGFSYVKWEKGDYGTEGGKENLRIKKTSFGLDHLDSSALTNLFIKAFDYWRT